MTVAINVYECMFLLDTNKVAGDVSATAKQLHTIIEKYQGEILASRPWDERRLAYPINGHKKGLYYLMYFRVEGRKLVEIEKDLSLNETVIRSLFIKIDPKILENMLAVARDEHALALQVVPDGGDDATEGIPELAGRGGSRRGRHDDDK